MDNEDLYEEEIARMVALDGLSFNQIATAKFIQKSLKKIKRPPSSSATVLRIVISYYKSKADKLKVTLKVDSEQKQALINA